jgi:hypothetical protein
MPRGQYPRASLEDRLWSKVEVTGFCWLWTGGIGPKGYGHFSPTPQEKVRAHRYVYEFLIGTIPDGSQLDHLCRIKRCVNPDHLEPVTGKVNVSRIPRVTYRLCPQGHGEINEGNSYLEKGRMRCKECNNIRNKRRSHLT